MALAAALLMVATLIWPQLLLPVSMVMVVALFLRSIGFLRFLSLTRHELTVLSKGGFPVNLLGRLVGWAIIFSILFNSVVTLILKYIVHPEELEFLYAKIPTYFNFLLSHLANIDAGGMFSLLFVVSLLMIIYWFYFMMLVFITNGSIFYYLSSKANIRGAIGFIVVLLFMVGFNVTFHMSIESVRRFFDKQYYYDQFPEITVLFSSYNSFISILFPLFLFCILFIFPRLIFELLAGRSPDADASA